MRIRNIVMTVLALCAVLALPAFAGDADGAAKDNWLKLCGLETPSCCDLTCVSLDMDCCGDCCGENGSKENLIVELWGADKALLATANISGPFCDCCACGDFTAQLDNKVDPCLVEAVTLRLESGEDNISLEWLRLSFGADCGCCDFDWHTAWKGDVWCCETIGKDGYDGVWIY
jgi:hypothetical protein